MQPYHANTRRYDYQREVNSLADTTLFEETLKTVEAFEKNRGNPNNDCHWKNGILYSEFHRRGIHDKYYDAHNIVQKRLGKRFSAIR